MPGRDIKKNTNYKEFHNKLASFYKNFVAFGVINYVQLNLRHKARVWGSLPERQLFAAEPFHQLLRRIAFLFLLPLLMGMCEHVKNSNTK